MSAFTLSRLEGRSLIAATGPEAADYLDRTITQKVTAADDHAAGYGALLTPQGKIIADFLFVRAGEGFLIDCASAMAGDLLKRLTMFRLRAKVELADVTADHAVFAAWGDGDPADLPGLVRRDPRLPGAGYRAYVPAAAAATVIAEETSAWLAHRIAIGLPELGRDAPAGDSFPHDIAMDELAGVSFSKGCFVGQEVVSRMKHRGTARRRPVLLTSATGMPEAGTDIRAGERVIGTVGSAAGDAGLAILRLDRIKDAQESGQKLSAGDKVIEAALPAWAGYGWPSAPAADD